MIEKLRTMRSLLLLVAATVLFALFAMRLLFGAVHTSHFLVLLAAVATLALSLAFALGLLEFKHQLALEVRAFRASTKIGEQRNAILPGPAVVMATKPPEGEM